MRGTSNEASRDDRVKGGETSFLLPSLTPPPMPIPQQALNRPARGYDCRATNLNMNLHIKGNLLIPKEASPNTKGLIIGH